MFDETTEFGARVARHLREEIVVWLTSVTPSGAPLPAPVWFIWDGAEHVTMYSMPGVRATNLAANPRVALNFGGDGDGGDVVVISGEATIDPEYPRADHSEDYLAKYHAHIGHIGMTAVTFADQYSVPVRIQLTRVRGH